MKSAIKVKNLKTVLFFDELDLTEYFHDYFLNNVDDTMHVWDMAYLKDTVKMLRATIKDDKKGGHTDEVAIGEGYLAEFNQLLHDMKIFGIKFIINA